MTSFMNGVRLLWLGALCLILANCSATVPASYTPQSFMEVGKGEVAVDEFSYAPMASGAVAANQLQNTAVGAVYIATNVADFVKRATALELDRAGLKVRQSADYHIEGAVEELKLDDLGYSVDWTYQVRYILSSPADSSVVIDKVYRVGPIRTGKFGLPSDYSPSLNQLVLEGVESFMDDLRDSGVFSSPDTIPMASDTISIS